MCNIEGVFDRAIYNGKLHTIVSNINKDYTLEIMNKYGDIVTVQVIDVKLIKIGKKVKKATYS